MPPVFEPAEQPPTVDIAPFAGTYRREGVLITVTEKAHLTDEFVDGMKGLSPPIEADLVPISETVVAGEGAGPSFSEGWMPVVFSTLKDGNDYCYIGMRAAPKVAPHSP